MSISPLRSASSSSGRWVAPAMWPASHSWSARTSTSWAPSSISSWASSRETSLASLCRSSVDVRSLDQEGDPHVGPVLVEVLAADPGRDDVDGADVAQGPLRLASACFAASSVEVFELPTSSMIFTTAIASLLLGPESFAWRRPPRAAPPAATGSPSPRPAPRGVVSAMNCSTAAAIAAASAGLALRSIAKAYDESTGSAGVRPSCRGP